MTDDTHLWAQYAKGVKKLGEKPPENKPEQDRRAPGAAVPEKEPPKDAPRLTDVPEAWRDKIVQDEPPAPQPAPERAPPTPEPKSEPSKPWKKEPLDLRIERNLSLGDVVIEAKLDLHGLTESEAHERLLAFIEKQNSLKRRLVLVITGRGRNGDSVLRANLPRWCDVSPLDEIVWAVRTAAPHHGGDGAYYLLLRRRSA